MPQKSNPSGLLVFFVNKVLLEHSHTHLSMRHHGCSHARRAELSSDDRDPHGSEPKILTIWPFLEKVC